MNAPTGAVMVMLSPEEFRRTIAAEITPLREQLAAFAEREPAPPPHVGQADPATDAEPIGLTTDQAMKRLGYGDYKCFKAAIRRLGITPYRPSPRKVYYAPEEIDAALERDRARGHHRTHYTRRH